MQPHQHGDLECGPCLTRKIDSLAQLISSISQTVISWLSFKAVILPAQVQGDRRLSSITFFCLFISRKQEQAPKRLPSPSPANWQRPDPALFCATHYREERAREEKSRCCIRSGWVLRSPPMGESPGSSARDEGMLRAHPGFSFPTLTYRMAHSSANNSEGLAQSKNVSILAGTRQTLLLPSKLARLVITTDFTNVLEF